MDVDERLAVFLDYENLALGARDHLGGIDFDFGPIADALAVRGRTLVRRAYADWSYFDEDRRSLTRHQVELIEMPQRMGMARKNAADIKMVVDAIEMAFSREYISTFVICTGDSDFSPLVHKLRELDRRVIGVGVEQSTSRLLPPACDEFLFYDRLEGVEIGDAPPPRGRRGRGFQPPARRTAEPQPASTSGGAGSGVRNDGAVSPSGGTASSDAAAERRAIGGDRAAADAGRDPSAAASAVVASPDDAHDVSDDDARDRDSGADEPEQLDVRIAQTLASAAAATDTVTASVLKRALLRRDPTFSESDHGFRSFGEVLRHLAERGIVELSTGPAAGDPEVSLPERGGLEQAFELLGEVLGGDGGAVPLSGLKDRMRKRAPDFSEKSLGYRSFLQFARGAEAAGHVSLRWDDDAGDYLVVRRVSG